MKKVEHLLQQFLMQLPVKPVFRRELPEDSRNTAHTELHFPVHCDREPVMEIRYGNSVISGTFYVLNRRLCGRYGIAPDEPLARDSSFEFSSVTPETLQQIRAGIAHVMRQRKNQAEVPPERKRDAMQEILRALPPEVLSRNCWHYYFEAGSREPYVAFENHLGWEPELHVGYSSDRKGWLVDFAVLRHNACFEDD